MDFYEQQLGYTRIEGKKYRRGITTGTCATAAAKAAAIYLMTGEAEETVDVLLPQGGQVKVQIHRYEKDENSPCVKAFVKKFAGDDIDVTNGLLIGAAVQRICQPKLLLEGGEGVGIVTKNGLQIPKGESAINPVPRSMIFKNLEEFCQEKGFQITLLVPEGEDAAKKTFNPRIGIEKGISILGTTGIVEPMSEEGYKKSLLAELAVKKRDYLALTPGNYGEKFLNAMGIDSSRICITSNFIGYILREGAGAGCKGFLVAGHAGKLVKLAGGIFHTHSHVADGKNHILVAHLALRRAPFSLLEKVMQANTTDEAAQHVKEYGFQEVWTDIAQMGSEKSRLHTWDQCHVAVILFDIQGNILGQSANAAKMIEDIQKSK